MPRTILESAELIICLKMLCVILKISISIIPAIHYININDVFTIILLIICTVHCGTLECACRHMCAFYIN